MFWCRSRKSVLSRWGIRRFLHRDRCRLLKLHDEFVRLPFFPHKNLLNSAVGINHHGAKVVVDRESLLFPVKGQPHLFPQRGDLLQRSDRQAPEFRIVVISFSVSAEDLRSIDLGIKGKAEEMKVSE